LSPGSVIGGAYNDPPDPLAAFDGPTSKRGEWRKGVGRKGERNREEGRYYTPPKKILSYATD